MHPCQNCGACCAIYRVSFSREELAPTGVWKVPRENIFDSGKAEVSFKGTLKSPRPSCDYLAGKIGKRVGCEIYQNRPSPCRNFKASYEDGYHKERCDEARRAHGLRALTKLDWIAYRENEAAAKQPVEEKKSTNKTPNEKTKHRLPEQSS